MTVKAPKRVKHRYFAVGVLAFGEIRASLPHSFAKRSVLATRKPNILVEFFEKRKELREDVSYSVALHRVQPVERAVAAPLALLVWSEGTGLYT